MLHRLLVLFNFGNGHDTVGSSADLHFWKLIHLSLVMW